MLDNPKINSAISLDRGTTRISHLGLQAEDDELAMIKGRIVASGVTYDAAKKDHRCIARKRCGRPTDPKMIRLEAFATRRDS